MTGVAEIRLLRMLLDGRLEDRSQAHEFRQRGRFAEVLAGAQPHGVGLVLVRIGRAENHDRRLVTAYAVTNTFEHFATGFLWQIQVDDREAGARARLSIVESPDKLNRLLAVREHQKTSVYAVLFEGAPDQSRIGGVIFNQENKHEIWLRS